MVDLGDLAEEEGSPFTGLPLFDAWLLHDKLLSRLKLERCGCGPTWTLWGVAAERGGIRK